MNIDELINEIDVSLARSEVDRNVSNMKLSAIFKKAYDRFENIRLKYEVDISGKEKQYKNYTTEIQAFLTLGGKFQKDGSPISENQILQEMYRMRKRKGLVVPGGNNFIAPTIIEPSGDLKGSGKVKVSGNNFKAPTVAVDMEAVEPKDYVSELDLVDSELQAFNTKKVPMVWRNEDEWMLIECTRLSKLYNTKIGQIEKYLLPKFDINVRQYYYSWLIKARALNKLPGI